MKLISMTDFVLEQSKNALLEEYHQVNETFVNKVIAYANFLKTPLKLRMFIPCDINDELFKLYHFQNFNNEIEFEQHLKDYEQAKKQVLFKGFSIEEHEPNNFSIRDENNILNVMWKFENENWRPAKGIKTLEDLVQFNLEFLDTVSF